MQNICKRCLKNIKKTNWSVKDYCTGCRTTIRRIKLKEKAIEYKGGKCEHCGYSKCNRALTFHHKDPSKKLYILTRSKMACTSGEKIKDELDKCVLLCANCHSELHDQEILDKYNQIEKTFQ
jgi:hypothetical protein